MSHPYFHECQSQALSFTLPEWITAELMSSSSQQLWGGLLTALKKAKAVVSPAGLLQWAALPQTETCSLHVARTTVLLCSNHCTFSSLLLHKLVLTELIKSSTTIHWMNAEDKDENEIEKREGGWKELKKMDRWTEI